MYATDPAKFKAVSNMVQLDEGEPPVPRRIALRACEGSRPLRQHHDSGGCGSQPQVEGTGLGVQMKQKRIVMVNETMGAWAALRVWFWFEVCRRWIGADSQTPPTLPPPMRMAKQKTWERQKHGMA